MRPLRSKETVSRCDTENPAELQTHQASEARCHQHSQRREVSRFLLGYGQQNHTQTLLDPMQTPPQVFVVRKLLLAASQRATTQKESERHLYHVRSATDVLRYVYTNALGENAAVVCLTPFIGGHQASTTNGQQQEGCTQPSKEHPRPPMCRLHHWASCRNKCRVKRQKVRRRSPLHLGCVGAFLLLYSSCHGGS